MKYKTYKLNICCMLILAGVAGRGQSPSPTDDRAARLQTQIEAISSALAATQQQLEQSQLQMKQLQQQLLELQQQVGNGEGSAASSSAVASPAQPTASTAPIEDREQAVEAAVKLHDQTKVESTSKYPVRLTGLILFNSYLNKGVPDNSDLPAIASRSTATSGNGSMGASLRQTVLGIEGNGPLIAGAHTSGNVSIDFFAGIPYTSYGTSAGFIRMRTASINFDWAKDSLQVGMMTPLISPLSPSSYATVAEPSLAGAGNLWTWAPQLRYAHRIYTQSNEKYFQLELGLWDSPAAGYNPNQLFRSASPAELSKQPSYETRLSYGADGDMGMQLGVSGYYSHQAYPGALGGLTTQNINSWATTTDFRLPFGHAFQISGEGYRGRAIGGLGAGVYKDVITGTDPITSENKMRALNAIGGWAQFKTRFTRSLENNLSIGLDNGYASDFHALVLSPTATAPQLRARNKMAVANLIYKPKTYIILSPEYRRIWSWPISGTANTVDIFTLSAGYQF